MASIAVTTRFDLTDAQWAVLAPLLPTPKKSGRPSGWTKRQLVDGIRWRVSTGSPWRDVLVPDPTRPDRVLAGKAYTSRANRAYLRRRGI